MELLFRREVYTIVGAAFEVYNVLGPGFLEAVYQDALSIEFAERGIPFLAQAQLQIVYKGHALTKGYLPDFVCNNSIVVELKAIDQLTTIDHAQLLNYLKAAKLTTGVLINFGSPHRLQWKRMVLSNVAGAAWRTSNQQQP